MMPKPKGDTTYKQFVNGLKNGQTYPVHLFYGKEDFLFKDSLGKLKKVVLGKEISDFNFTVYDGEDCSAGDVMDALNTLPLFGGSRLIIVKNFDELKKGDVTDLGESIEDIPSSSFLVLHSNKEKVDGRLKLVNNCKKHGLVVNLRRLYPNELILWVKHRAKIKNVQFEDNALGLFMELVGNNLWDVENELDKLSVYIGKSATKVKEEQVKAISASAAEKIVFDVVDAIAEKDKGRALKLTSQMLGQGTPMPLLLSVIIRQVYLMLKTKIALEEDGRLSPPALAKRLGTATYPAQKCLEQHSNFTLAELKDAFFKLTDVERALKTGRGNGELSLELAIISIVS